MRGRCQTASPRRRRRGSGIQSSGVQGGRLILELNKLGSGLGPGARRAGNGGAQGDICTLIQFKVGDGLPLVRCNEPLVPLLPAAQVDDQLRRVVLERGEDGVQARVREGARGEEVRGYYHLLR